MFSVKIIYEYCKKKNHFLFAQYKNNAQLWGVKKQKKMITKVIKYLKIRDLCISKDFEEMQRVFLHIFNKKDLADSKILLNTHTHTHTHTHKY